MASVVEVFPRRPLALAKNSRRRNWRIVLLIVALLSALPAAYWGYQTWSGQLLRADLRARGVRAADTMVADGECTSRRSRLGNSSRPIACWFTVSYRLRPEEGGTERKAEMRLEGGSPIFTPPVIYDPEDPGRAMLQPEVERAMTWSELLGPIALLLIPAMILVAFFATARRGLAAAAANPRPLVVAIEQAIRQPGRIFLHTRAPGADKTMVDTFSAPAMPLLVSPPVDTSDEQQWALALKSPKGRHYVLDSELAWLDLTQEERSRLLNAARGS
jgi:hypothetical protein